jgi:hypothetical protein
LGKERNTSQTDDTYGRHTGITNNIFSKRFFLMSCRGDFLNNYLEGVGKEKRKPHIVRNAE